MPYLKDEIIHISIPQRSDLNSLLRWDTMYCLSFQSRNGLIWTQSPSTAASVIFYFNPATVWFEPQEVNVMAAYRIHFNPATVWFELIRGNGSLGRRWLFQSRNGLIWTSCCCADKWRATEFQSRNGLIWTIYIGVLPMYYCYFNPATVWFEPSPTK